MQASSLEVLEYAALRDLIGRYVAGPLGRAELERIEPLTDRPALESTLAELAEAIEFARSESKLPLAGLVDSSASVQKLRIEGASLEGTEIANLVTFLERATEVRLSIVTLSSRFPRLTERAGRIGEFRLLLRDLSGKVLPNGNVADTASVALNRLRREIERQQRRIQESLERFVRMHRDEGILQEDYVTIRNDRFVVPVVAGQKRKVDGVIHGASGSGQTLFIEPLETIDLNNELVRLREEEAREVHRILREITERLREHAAAIRQTLNEVSAFDLLFAKSAFAIDYDCVIPRFSPDEQRRIHLKRARHPLLESVLRREQRRVVPLSVTLDERVHTLLISGPNTGGKTVAMKTVGLLALMAQSGIAVPAEEAEFPIFDQVLADIGDQQSIEQSLSTFSAHITCIRNMIEKATVDSLVLLDELGRATDPEEGGALGVAILEHFRGIRSFTLASTHLLALKIYGANTETVLNGSMGFDEDTLQPTYALHLGAPGKSAGLDIATRLGLPPRIIERARAAMSTTERDIARFLSELHSRLEAVDALEIDLRRRIEEVDRRQAQLTRDFEKREAEKIRELEGRNAEVVARFEAEAKQTIDSILQVAANRKASEQAQRKVAKTRREFHEAFAEAVRETAPEAAPPIPRIEEGARVRLKGVRSPARVRRLLADHRLEVEAGLVKMQVSLDDVEEVLPAEREPASRLPKNVTFRQAGPRWDVPYSELNLIGKRAEEATDELDKFLDQAALAQVMRVRIIHGHGMGVLKRAVGEYLKRSPHVEKFYPASDQEGGTGATIAELKES
jgi:DNA mismatch repair protein MutS2